MKPFFSTPERIQALRAEVLSWKGTPFVDNACIKGAGVSCQKFVTAPLIALGHLPAGFVVPDGPTDWGRAHKQSLMEPAFAKLDQFEVVQWPPQPGDIISFVIGGCIHHLGLVVDDLYFWHALKPRGVQQTRIDDATWLKRVGKIWRPVEP